MDVLSIYGAARSSPLDEIARLSGLPGKLGMDGGQVWDATGPARSTPIRDYCETDVANTYLLYLRFQMMRGALSPERYAEECALLRGLLEKRAGAALGQVPVALDPLILEIESLDSEGRGVARDAQGKVLFVEGALPGEHVSFLPQEKKRSFEVGRALEILKPSPGRRAPPCPHFGVCGGCALQHVDVRTQMAAKQRGLEENLARIGKVAAETMLPIVYGQEWGYRRRARLSVRYVTKKGACWSASASAARRMSPTSTRASCSTASLAAHPAPGRPDRPIVDPQPHSADRGGGRRCQRGARLSPPRAVHGG